MSPRGVRLTWALLLGFFSLTIGCGRGGFFGGGYVCPEPGACEVWVGASSSAPMVRVGGPTPGNPIEGPYACPPGTLLTGLYTEYESNDRLIGFRMHCHELSLNEATGTLATVNPVDGGENFGSQAMEYTQDLDCGANLVVSSLRAYTGAWQAGTADTQVMDRIEVGCSSISVDIDGTSVTGPPPVHRTDPPRHVGHPAQQSGPGNGLLS